MIQIPEAEGHARDLCAACSIHDFLVKISAQFLSGRFIAEGDAIAQKIADSLVDRKAKKAACKLMICRPHVLVCLALQVVEDFFITIDRRIQSAIIQLRIRCGLVSRRPSVLRNSSADKCDSALFALAGRK